MQIVLIGMPYSGKSTLGKRLAKQLGMTFYDTDTWIEREFGAKVSDIFASAGEAQFREYEYQALEFMAGQQQSVIATGGGIITTVKNREKLKKLTSIIIYLDVPIPLLEARAARKTGPVRPLLQQRQVRELFYERQRYYKEVATIRINCHRKPVPKILAEIITKVEPLLAKE
ncbi:MAG: shikimate kinase [Culicoidibacterales bacterium]